MNNDLQEFSDLDGVFPSPEGSFSAQAKAEISRTAPAVCCRRFLLSAMLESAREYQVYEGPVLRFASAETARFAVKVLRGCGADFAWTCPPSKASAPGSSCVLRLLEVPRLGKVKRILNLLGPEAADRGSWEGDLRFRLHHSGNCEIEYLRGSSDEPFSGEGGSCEALPSEPRTQGTGKNLLLKLCCRRSWLSGLFMCFGSVADPRRFYCMEWALPDEELARKAESCLKLDGLVPAVFERRRSWVVSLKRAEEVSAALTVIGANLSRLNYEEIMAFKETRNDVGRLVNAESANLARSSSASVRQMACISLLRRIGVLDTLAPELQNAARVRIEHPDASLRELCVLADPPVARTTLSRRLARLEEISGQYGQPGAEDCNF